MPPVTAERSPPALADDRRRFAGDRGFVHRRDALDHVAVAGDDVARFDQHEIAGLQIERGDLLEAAASSARDERFACVCVRVRRRFSACALPRPSATASAKLAKITVNHSQNTIWAVNRMPPLPATMSRIDEDGRQHRDDLDHEHDGIAGERARVELAERSRAAAIRISEEMPATPRLRWTTRSSAWRCSCFIVMDMTSVQSAGLHLQVLDDGPERQSAGK